MSVFPRRSSPAIIVRHYSDYRPLVREDFRECCAYCLLHELAAGGQDNFELDHFRPKSKPEFEDKINDFLNLYYSCHVCNHYKGTSWPPPDLEHAGYVFVDLCQEGFSAHFHEEADGSWTPLTHAAEYTIRRLRLNRRHLVEIRSLLRLLADAIGCEPLNWEVTGRDQLIRLFAAKPQVLGEG